MDVGFEFTHAEHNYKLTKKLPEGGFSAVFCAQQSRTDRPAQLQHIGAKRVAIKFPSPQVLQEPSLVSRFRRESKILANIDHPNVVKVFDFVEFEDGNMAIIQEYVQSAKHLTDYLHEHPQECLSAALQALYAIRTLHSKETGPRVLHRDVSPNNILVDPNGTVQLIDFGFARSSGLEHSNVTNFYETFGTQGCTAPEQEDAIADVDERTDIYALGKSLAAAILNRKPKHVDLADVPRPWGPICSQMAAFDQEARFDSAESVISRVLHDFLPDCTTLGNMTVHATEFGTWSTPPPEWARFADTLLQTSDHLSRDHLDFCFNLGIQSVSDGHFQASVVYQRLDSGIIAETYEHKAASFSQCDPLADFIELWFPLLDDGTKLMAWHRLLTTSIEYHRFHLMEAARSIYSTDAAAPLRTQLAEMLFALDPDQEIYRWNGLPENPQAEEP